MIYQLSQVSNRDTQVLYFYRILRHNSNELNQLYRYDKPNVYQLDRSRQIEIDNEIWYEYILDAEVESDRIPYLEFQSEDEAELKAIEDLVEVEVTSNSITLRGKTNRLTNKTTVFVYWVPSLGYIQKLQDQIEKILSELGVRLDENRKKIQKLGVSSDYVMNVEGLVPNLVAIGEDDTGYIYDDSHYMLSGSLAEQLLLNPPQSLVSSLLKSHTGTLTIKDTHRSSKVYQGFYGGRICLSGNYETLVLKDITSIIFLSDIAADKIVIKNCPAVIFRQSLQEEGSSNQIHQLDVLNSYLTIYQQINIDSIWIYQQSTVILKKGTIHEVGWLEAGSTLVQDKPDTNNTIEELKITPIQGLFYATRVPDDQPYLDEIFLEHKPISFQRGQVEDPIPIKEAIVHIYLKHSGKPGPSPTPSGKIYSPFTDWYWSGDSRVVQLIAQTHTDGKGYGGESLPKLREVQTEIETEGAQHNIILWWGVNGLSYGASSYADVYKSIANDVGSNAMVFVGTVGHCPDGTGSGKVDGGGGQDLVTFNAEIEQFNSDLVASLTGVSNIYVLDIAKYVKELEADKGAAWLTDDNLHYKPEASQMIYDWVCNQITNTQAMEVDTHYTPFPEYVSIDLSDSYMGVLPGIQNIDQNIGLGIMYGISIREYGNNPVSWLYARMFRTFLLMGTYKVFSRTLTEEGRALLNPETGAWSFGSLYTESGLLQTVRSNGTQEGLENFYYMLKYGGVMTGYTDDMDDIAKMKIIAGGAPTGNNSLTGCPQDGQFHENFYAAGIVDARWIYDSPCSWIPYGTGRMTYYSAQSTATPGQLNPNV